MQEDRQISEEEFREWADEINTNSPYKKKRNGKKKYMTVHEMGDLLGVKKTERYWIVKKGYFKTDETPYGMRVDIESFEKWYANQDKYHKVTGEEPGTELKKRSLSARDIAKLLDIGEWQVYEEMNRARVPFVIVNFTKRFPVPAFENWYRRQTKYKKVEDQDMKLEEATMRMPEMARLLGVPRSTVYSILDRYEGIIETVVIGDRRRVVKKSFYDWYKTQDKYHLVGNDLPVAIEKESNPQIELMRRDTYHMDGSAKNIGNTENLTIREAALLADVNPATITKWIKGGRIPSVKLGKVIRIPREAFEEWLHQQ